MLRDNDDIILVLMPFIMEAMAATAITATRRPRTHKRLLNKALRVMVASQIRTAAENGMLTEAELRCIRIHPLPMRGVGVYIEYNHPDQEPCFNHFPMK